MAQAHAAFPVGPPEDPEELLARNKTEPAHEHDEPGATRISGHESLRPGAAGGAGVVGNSALGNLAYIS